MAMIAGPAISSSDDRITRPTDAVARTRYGFRYRRSRRARCLSKALAPSSSCFSISLMGVRRQAAGVGWACSDARGPRPDASCDLRQFLLNGLPPIEIRVIPVVCEQRLVRAALHDPAVVQDDDLIGVFHRRDAMRDDENRPSAPDFTQRAQDALLGRRIHGA